MSDKPPTITITELARNLAKAMKKIENSGNPLFITKRGRLTATLYPPPKPEVDMKDFINILNDSLDLDDCDTELLSQDTRKKQKTNDRAIFPVE